MKQSLSLAILFELFLLAQADLPARVDVLARALHSDALTVGHTLAELEARGLVDAARCRLTMQGLVFATALGAQRDRSQHHAA